MRVHTCLRGEPPSKNTLVSMPSFVIQQLTLVEADQHLQLEIIFYAAKSLHHSFIAVFSLGLSGPPRPNQGELGMAGFCLAYA